MAAERLAPLGALVAGLVLLAMPAPVPAQLRDQATGAVFDQRIAFAYEGKEYNLRATGLAVRRVLFFKVYAMAHYADAPAGLAGDALLERVLSDDVAKQVTMQFSRDIAGDRIASSLVESIRRNAGEETLRAAAPAIERFSEAIDQDVRKGERFTVRWLPGGLTVCLFNDRQVLVVHNGAFGRALWSMWFGERPIVDRASLLAVDGTGSS